MTFEPPSDNRFEDPTLYAALDLLCTYLLTIHLWRGVLTLILHKPLSYNDISRKTTSVCIICYSES